MASAVPLPNGQTQCIDGDGVPYANGKLYHYIPGTLTPKTTWQDPNEASTNPNPVILDGAGRATIFGDGSYRQILQDRLGNQVWDRVTVALGSSAIIATIPDFTGDTGAGGARGLVPAPPVGSTAAGDYLSADGSWGPLDVVVPTVPAPNQAGLLLVPQRAIATTSGSLLLSDAGGAILYANAGAGTLLITDDSTANWLTGVVTQIMVYNQASSGNLVLTQDTVTVLLWPGNTATGTNRTLAANGQCLLSRVAANTWTVVGSGLS